MMRCMTSAIAGLRAHQLAMDVIGNNISNVDTPSFKSGSTAFRDTMYQEVTAGSGGTASGAGMNPSEIGYGAAATGVVLNTTKGGENATGINSDVYIDGEGYLIIGNSARDTSGTYLKDSFTNYKYTRIGALSFDSKGYLTDGTGNYVCGQQNTVAGQATVTLSPSAATNGTYNAPDGSTVPPPVAIHYDPSLGSLSNTSIASDGTITATQAGKTITIGKIGLASFTNASGLQQMGNGFYAAPASGNTGTTQYSVPSPTGAGKLITGALEASNVDLASEFSNMIMYERGYQANTKIISVSDEMYQTLVNMK
ncbi:MAG TPA: flagellar hook-basal body complex protein [Caproicibacter sp.]|nr:flagellar hook-basal body complex protein [Caproicibacter sp.]